MMWLRRNYPILIAAVIFFAMVGWSVLLLKRAKSAQSKAEREHRDLEQRLKTLIDAPIFPNKDNVDILRVQARQLNEYYQDIYNRLPKEKKEYQVVDKWKCKGLIETRVNEMKKHCLTNKIQVGSSMNFGFSRYMGTSPPKEEDTPLLLHQLDLAEKLMTLLVSSRVNEIATFRRTFLSGETGSDEKVEGATWVREPKAMYESQTFDIVVRSGDEQARTVLNNIAATTNLILLARTLTIESEKANPQEPAGTGGGSAPNLSRSGPAGAFPPPTPPTTRQGNRPPTAPPAPSSNPGAPATEGQIVMGNEVVTITLRIDVIELRLPDQKEGGDKAKTAAAVPTKKASLP